MLCVCVAAIELKSLLYTVDMFSRNASGTFGWREFRERQRKTEREWTSGTLKPNWMQRQWESEERERERERTSERQRKQRQWTKRVWTKNCQNVIAFYYFLVFVYWILMLITCQTGGWNNLSHPVCTTITHNTPTQLFFFVPSYSHAFRKSNQVEAKIRCAMACGTLQAHHFHIDFGIFRHLIYVIDLTLWIVDKFQMRIHNHSHFVTHTACRERVCNEKFRANRHHFNRM